MAFSRVRSISGVRVLALNSHDQGLLTHNPHHVYTKNIVYREVLADRNLPRQPVLTLRTDQDEEQMMEFDLDVDEIAPAKVLL